MTTETISDERVAVTLIDAQPTPDNVRATVVAGLSSVPRMLPPKLFYDDAGARLFERITGLDEYYPTRTELSILREHVGAMAECIGAEARIVEFGSGSGLKTRILLEHLERPAAYVPVDIARTQLVQFALDVAADFPALDVTAVCADYTQGVPLPEAGAAARTVAFFPGSTIGNFEPAGAERFLVRVAELCGSGGGLLIGADLHKDVAVLERAYNDAEGVTAAFNLNMLARINVETGADFDLGAFRHEAFYDVERRRIEMRLVAARDTRVSIPDEDAAGAVFEFEAGDYITTEYSHKYTEADFRALAERTGWTVRRMWTDEQRWFSVWLLERA